MNDFASLLGDLLRNDAVEPVLRDVYRPCRRLIALADFCQDVLVRALQNQESFRGQGRSELIGWLRSIGQQWMITLLRRCHREALDPLPDCLPDREATASEVLIRKERLAWLMEILATLDQQDRDLLIRHYYLGETFVQIAKQQGQNPNTLVRRHVRLLEKLRQAREF